jgi:predicted component of type VI protein secretion system
MAQLEQQTAGAAFAGVTVEGNDFASLLNKEFKPKSDEAKSAVEAAVQTLAQQALANVKLISSDTVASIEAMIAGAGPQDVRADQPQCCITRTSRSWSRPGADFTTW